MTTYLNAVDDTVRWAYRQPQNSVYRRMEIYEADCVTQWFPSIGTERLIGGSINLSYDRDERRQLNSLQIANFDGILSYDPNGFWYDKVLKIFRGLRFWYEGDYFEYEAQVGEFEIDKITEPAFPHVLTVNGRDHTKRLLNDKFAEATTFTANSKVDDVVKTIAYNGGITKFRLNSGGVTLGADLALDKDSTRWAGIKSATTPYALDAYFDREGYLVTEPQSDVSTTAPYFIFGADDDTDGASTAERSVTDTAVYNDLVVRSSNSDAETAGIAPASRWQNTDPNSPTAIAKIGRHSNSYESDLFLTKADTDAYLSTWKKTAALETWEMTFGFRFLPWLEVGKVIELPDTDNENVPARYLLTDIDAPIGIGAVSGTGKRLTIIA